MASVWEELLLDDSISESRLHICTWHRLGKAWQVSWCQETNCLIWTAEPVERETSEWNFFTVQFMECNYWHGKTLTRCWRSVNKEINRLLEKCVLGLAHYKHTTALYDSAILYMYLYVVIMYLLLSCKLEIAHHDSPKSLHDPLVPLGSGTSRKVSYCPVATQRWAWDLTAIPSLYNHHHATTQSIWEMSAQLSTGKWAYGMMLKSGMKQNKVSKEFVRVTVPMPPLMLLCSLHSFWIWQVAVVRMRFAVCPTTDHTQQAPWCWKGKRAPTTKRV